MLADVTVEECDEDSLWDAEDLLPLLPAGTNLASYVSADDNLEISNTMGDTWEEEIMTATEETEENEDGSSNDEKDDDDDDDDDDEYLTDDSGVVSELSEDEYLSD